MTKGAPVDEALKRLRASLAELEDAGARSVRVPDGSGDRPAASHAGAEAPAFQDEASAPRARVSFFRRMFGG